MLTRIKQYIWIGLAIAVFYYLLNHHFIIFNYKDFEILRKSEPTLEYTFFSLKQVEPMEILQIDALIDAGIEDVMLDRGLITEERLDHYFDIIEKLKARQTK